MSECWFCGVPCGGEERVACAEHRGICTDCGAREVHPDCLLMGFSYCRRCADKGGNGYLFVTKVDHDRLRERFDEETILRIRECAAD